MVRLSLLLLSVALLLGVAPADAQPEVGPEPQVPLRIMPMGDSITEGDNTAGYRWPLFRMITRELEMPNFVGHRSGRFNDDPEVLDSDHDGYSAYRIEQIASGGGNGSFWNAPTVEERLEDWDPRIVLLHAGTNDMLQNHYLQGDPDQGIPNVVERLENLIDRICTASPEIHVIVAQIVPANPPADPIVDRRIQAFNSHIPDVVARQQALDRNVTMVDLYTPMLGYPHPDGIHPSRAGYQVMATVWFEAIQAIAPVSNFNPGRDDGVRLTEYYSTVTPRPWAPSAASLIADGAPTLERSVHQGYTSAAGSPDLLTDGDAGASTREGDNTWTSVYVLDTSAHPEGYDVTRIRSASGWPAVGEAENVQQAYEVWYTTVDAPGDLVRLGDFHHIVVNELSLASGLVIEGEGGEPLARRVKSLAFRFEEPPRRQGGFFGIGLRTRYYELEVEGTPSPRSFTATADAERTPGVLRLDVAPNPFAGRTMLQVAVPGAASVRVTVHDVLGRHVATLLDGWVEAGERAIPFEAGSLPSGVYAVRVEAVRVEADGRVVSRRVTLTK